MNPEASNDVVTQARPGILFQVAGDDLQFKPQTSAIDLPTAQEMLQSAGRHPPADFTLIWLRHDGEMELLAADQRVQLHADKPERFLALLIDRAFFFTVDRVRKEWGCQFISGLKIKLLAGIDPETHGLVLLRPGCDPREIQDHELVDLGLPGIEHFETFRKRHQVTVTIDNAPKQIWAGEYTVPELKKALGVPPEKDLEQIINGVITPLPADKLVTICGGEIFISHAKRGGSSWTRSSEELTTLAPLCAGVVPMQEAGVEYIFLRELQSTIAGAPMPLDALLCPNALIHGYPTKLFIDRQVAPLLAKLPNRGLNWNASPVLFGRQWYTWSWNYVPSDLPLLEMLMNHLSALQ